MPGTSKKGGGLKVKIAYKNTKKKKKKKKKY